MFEADDIRGRYAQVGLDVSGLTDAQVTALWFADSNNDLDDALPELEDRQWQIDQMASGKSSDDIIVAYVGDRRWER